MKFSMFMFTQRMQKRDATYWVHHLREEVRLMEHYGLDSAIALHHYMDPQMSLQPDAMLSWIAGQTSKIRLGTGILLLPLLHPVHVAEEWATLDVLSEGRVFLGAGMAYRDKEFAAFGLDRSKRVGRFRESLEIIRRLWAGETVNFQGKHFQLDGVRLGVVPVQEKLNVWIGAGVEAAVRRSAHLGDAWMIPPDCKPRRAQGLLEVYRSERKAAGLPLDGEYPIGRDLILDEDPERAKAELLPYMREERKLYAQLGFEWFDRMFDDLTEKAFFVCTPEECVRRIREFEAMGINHMVMRANWGNMPLERSLKTLELLGTKVMPHFR